MLPFERLVVAYLVFFALVALVTRAQHRRRVRTSLRAASFAVAVYLSARTLPLDVRLWLPLFYIPLGYWIPVPLVPPARGGAFEAWLIRTDDAAGLTAVALPRWASWIVELGYLACFPLVPAAFAVVWYVGSPTDVARLWTASVTAGYACYLTLPWLVSRPPRLIESRTRDVEPSSVSRANVRLLGRVSHQLNTFPSGHVAVSVAAAISAGTVWPAAGLVFGTAAVAVTAGAVAGRYHFAVDVLAGAAVGVIATVLAR